MSDLHQYFRTKQEHHRRCQLIEAQICKYRMLSVDAIV
jgi:hypothetical protein